MGSSSLHTSPHFLFLSLQHYIYAVTHYDIHMIVMVTRLSVYLDLCQCHGVGERVFVGGWPLAQQIACIFFMRATYLMIMIQPCKPRSSSSITG